MPNPEQNKARKLFSGKLFRLFRKKKRKKEKSKLESQECCIPTKDSLVVECNEHLENVPCVSCDDSYNSSCSKAIDKEKTITADSKNTEHLYCEKIKENEKNRLREKLIKDNPISEENKNIVINVANDEDQSCKYFAAPVLENIENFENKLGSRSLDRTEQSIIVQNEVMELESANNDRSIDLKQVASTNKKEVDNIVSIAKEKTSSNVNNKCKELGKSSKIPKYIQELDIERIKDHRKTNKFLRKESETKIDENSSEDSDSFEDENKQLIVHEVNERNISDEYFTKGKYISYFLLEIERQSYDPTEVYSMIRYYDSDESNVSDSEGENSSSESMSPNIPTTLRRKLLHRLSADNLIVNSPTNSMRHSSPESIKSAPIQLKPRSTSHDALTRKKDRQATQIDSTDSLAKQALLAAQVLNLIPTQKARERNFLHGRIAANSLLGPVELEKVLPNREIKIFVGTWNMNGQTPPKELNDFMLPSEIETVPDMLAIGTQESCSERSEWEAALQETLGPSHVLLTSTALGTLHLALFLRRDLIWFCSVPEDSNFSTRPGTAFRTKGAVALALMLFGTSFLFVTAHLTAHQDKVKERVNDIKKIVRNLDLPKDLPTRHKDKDVTQNFDCVFWCGDLNFRLAQPREEVIQWVTDTQFPQEMPINLHKDQLRAILNEGAVLRGFKEAPITFPPTYKYDPGTQNFDSSSKQRTPAYTDRILFKGKGHTKGHIRRVNCEGPTSHKDGTLECLTYDSVPSICTSDHKPVWGVFKAILRPGIDTIPLAAGLFNRDVYLEGIKRRAAAMDETQGTSRICSIQ